MDKAASRIRLPFCIATVVVLRCNCIRFAWQKESILNEKDCFCEALHCLFWTVILQVVENQRFDANRLKLTNFESKISLCVQLAVLSDGKCKYCIALNCNVALWRVVKSLYFIVKTEVLLFNQSKLFLLFSCFFHFSYLFLHNKRHIPIFPI